MEINDIYVDATWRRVRHAHEQYIEARKFGCRIIREHRAKLGLSLADYAHCIGYNPTYISKIENEVVYPGEGLLEKARHLTPDVIPPHQEAPAEAGRGGSRIIS